jgi:hypothetical protein
LKIVRGLDLKTKQEVKWLFYLAVENGRNTSTKGMYMHVNFDGTYSGELPGDFLYPDVDPEGKPASPADNIPMVLGPKEKILTAPLAVTIDTIKEVQKKSKRLYFYGWTTYKDGFTDTPFHRTDFCYEVGGLTVHDGNVLSFIGACRHHNCTDEECEKR